MPGMVYPTRRFHSVETCENGVSVPAVGSRIVTTIYDRTGKPRAAVWATVTNVHGRRVTCEGETYPDRFAWSEVNPPDPFDVQADWDERA